MLKEIDRVWITKSTSLLSEICGALEWDYLKKIWLRYQILGAQKMLMSQ